MICFDKLTMLTVGPAGPLKVAGSLGICPPAPSRRAWGCFSTKHAKIANAKFWQIFGAINLENQVLLALKFIVKKRTQSAVFNRE